MPKFDNISIETAAMQRREAQDTRPQDQYAGRRKFDFCHRCGAFDGMQHVHHEILAEMTGREIESLAPWYHIPSTRITRIFDDYLYYPCPRCNKSVVVSDNFKPLGIVAILEWFNRDSMAPDYEALAAEESVSQIKDSRDSAGLEG